MVQRHELSRTTILSQTQILYLEVNLINLQKIHLKIHALLAHYPKLSKKTCCAKYASQPLCNNLLTSNVEITHVGKIFLSPSNSNFEYHGFLNKIFLVKQFIEARWLDNQSIPKITSKSEISNGIRLAFNTTPLLESHNLWTLRCEKSILPMM